MACADLLLQVGDVDQLGSRRIVAEHLTVSSTAQY